MKYKKIYQWLMGLFFLFGLLMGASITNADSQSSQAGITFQGDGSIEVSVLLTKRDIETKKELPNAIFELWKVEGEEKQVVDSSLVTNEKGQIKIERLFPGKYEFKEIMSPNGYQLDQTPLSFEVNFGKTEVDLTMYNKKLIPEIPTVVKEQTAQSFPKTGEQLSNHWIEYLGILLCLISFAYLTRKKNKK